MWSVTNVRPARGSITRIDTKRNLDVSDRLNRLSSGTADGFRCSIGKRAAAKLAVGSFARTSGEVKLTSCRFVQT